MIVKSGLYCIQLSEDTILDLSNLTKQDWQNIKAQAKQITIAGHAKDPCSAYIAAFITYISDLSELSEPYNPDLHKMN